MPEVQAFTFLIPIWQKRNPFYVPFIEKRYPFHIPTLEHCTPVTGQPFDNLRGRWCVGGGINVPLNVTIETNKTQATEIKHIVTKMGIQAILQNTDGKMKK